MPQAKIVVVEDENLVAQLTTRLLKDFGYTVLGSVSSGEEALRVVEESRPDLVLMDIGLPGPIDGVEAATQIRFRMNTPVIYLTTDANPSTVNRAKLAEPLGYILKPFNPEELRTTIETALYQFHKIQQRANEGLQQAERRYQLLFKNALEGIYQSSPDGRFLAANPALARMFGYESPAELLSSVTNIERQLYVQSGRRKDFERILHEIGAAKRFESRVRRKDGTEIWISENACAVRDESDHLLYYEAFVEDISESRRVEAAIRESENKYRALIETTDTGYVILDPEGRVLDANPAYVRLTGHGALEEILDRRVTEWTAQHDLARNAAEVRKCLECDFVRNIEIDYVNREGVCVPVEINATALRTADGVKILALCRDITGRKLAEQVLRESEARFRSLTDAAQDAIIMMDPEGRISFWNKAAERFFGYTQTEVMCKPLHEVIAPSHYLSTWQKGLQQFQKTGEGAAPGKTLELQAKRKDESIFPIELSVSAVDLRGEWHAVGIIRDISQRKRVEKALRESEAMYRVLFERGADGILIADLETRGFKYANPALCRMLGYPEEEMRTLSVADIHPKDALQSVVAEFEAQARGDKSLAPNIPCLRKDRSIVYADISATTVAVNGTECVVGFFRDITGRKRAEEQQAMMEIQLRHAMKLEAIGQLAAGIAHEINTPTQYVGDNIRFLQDAFADMSKALKSYDRLLQTNRQGALAPQFVEEVEAAIQEVDLGYLTEEIPRAIAQSLEGVGRVAAIVKAMREFSHPGREEKRAVDLNHAIESTITVCRNEWKYVAEMVTEFDPDLPPVPCLSGELNQVILNLIINASHAIADAVGGGENGKGTITVRTRHDSNWAEIRVSDTGTGIPEEHRGKIFTPFFTTKKVGKGTGQGLAISHSVVVGKHGGTIAFETELGKGTTFIIRLPLDLDLS